MAMKFLRVIVSSRRRTIRIKNAVKRINVNAKNEPIN